MTNKSVTDNEQFRKELWLQCNYPMYIRVCRLLNSYRSKIDAAKKALEFYGDVRNYSVNMEGDFEEHFSVGEYQKVGTFARKTLEDIE